MQTLTKAQIKHFSGLLRPAGRAEAGQFLAHGRKLASEALSSGWAVEALISTEAYWRERPIELPPSTPLYLCAEHEFAKLSDQPSPEGVVAVVRLPESSVPSLPLAGPALLGWRLNDPGNVGALLRIAAWFGLAGVWLSEGSADPFSPKAVRGSMGAVFRVNCGVIADFESLVTTHASRIAAAVGPESLASHESVLSPQQLRAAGRDLILLGSESHGLPQGLLASPGLATVSIAVRGTHPPESLNVAVAAGILTFALTNS